MEEVQQEIINIKTTRTNTTRQETFVIHESADSISVTVFPRLQSINHSQSFKQTPLIPHQHLK